MNTGFIDSGKWILPAEGTIGNKSRNLHDNSAVIEAQGLRIPRSLVIPYEYLREAEHPYAFTISQIDRYFPGWKRVMIRSDSPDEDLKFRFSGQYVTEHLWHADKELSDYLFGRVVESYEKPTAMLRRKQLGLPELGMGILVQPVISNTPGEFDAIESGCFSDIGELALVNFTNPHYGVDKMQKPPLNRNWADIGGKIVEGPSPVYRQEIVYKLRGIADSLPKIPGKGWEIEFIANNEGLYIVQTTQIMKRERASIPEGVENIFHTISAVGTGEIAAEGILYVPFLEMRYEQENKTLLEQMIKFDATHQGYCLAMPHSNYQQDGREILEYLANSALIIDLVREFWLMRPFAPHVQQYMREGRIAFAGTFTNKLGQSLLTIEDYFDRRAGREQVLGISYSKTKIVAAADEISGKGAVFLPDGKIHPFLPLS